MSFDGESCFLQLAADLFQVPGVIRPGGAEDDNVINIGQRTGYILEDPISSYVGTWLEHFSDRRKGLGILTSIRSDECSLLNGVLVERNLIISFHEIQGL